MTIRARHRPFILAAIVLTACAAAQPAGALFIAGSPTGLLNPTRTITFNELGNLQNQAITNQFQAFGASFSGGLFWDNGTLGQNGATGFAGGSLTSFIPGTGTVSPGPFTITFSAPVAAAAFAVVGQGNTLSFQAFRSGVQVDSGNLLVNFNPGPGFVGFQNVTFDKIVISAPPEAAIALDTLQFTTVAVPEPATLALGMGFLLPAGWLLHWMRKGKSAT